MITSRDQKVDLPSVQLGQFQEDLLAVAGLDHLVAAGAEQLGGDAAHRVLVLDEQDAADAAEVAGGRLGLGRLGRRRRRADGRGVHRQEDAEGRALADLGVERDPAVGLFDDAVDGGQAQARALAQPAWW